MKSVLRVFWFYRTVIYNTVTLDCEFWKSDCLTVTDSPEEIKSVTQLSSTYSMSLGQIHKVGHYFCA